MNTPPNREVTHHESFLMPWMELLLWLFVVAFTMLVGGLSHLRVNFERQLENIHWQPPTDWLVLVARAVPAGFILAWTLARRRSDIFVSREGIVIREFLKRREITAAEIEDVRACHVVRRGNGGTTVSEQAPDGSTKETRGIFLAHFSLFETLWDGKNTAVIVRMRGKNKPRILPTRWPERVIEALNP